MLFLTVLQNYHVMHKHSTMQALFNVEDGDDVFHVNFMAENNGQEGLYFNVNAEVIFDPEDAASFSVKDVDGNTIQFSAFEPAQLFEPKDERDINLRDLRIEITEPNRLWVKVGKFDVLLNHTGEGIVVDVWPWMPQDHVGNQPDEALATCYAFDSDADAAIGVDPDA